jgi:hypothetical protein
MGSLALAAWGAVGGAGKGIEAAGELEEKKQLMQKESDIAQARQETIARLQDKFEKENIANQQQFQLKGAAASRGFETQKQATEIASKEGIAARHETEATKRTNITAASRVEARKVGAPAAKEQKTWTPGHYQIGGGIDPVTKMPTPQTTIPVMEHKDGRVFVQAGDKFMLYDATKGSQLPDVKSVRNADPKAVQDLTNDPEGTVPDGSETKADAFQRAYGYLPSSYFSAAQRAEQQQHGGPVGPLGKNAPPGSKFVPGQPFGGGNASGNTQDIEDDAEDARNDNESYAQTGDEGPQPEDTMPAK